MIMLFFPDRLFATSLYTDVAFIAALLHLLVAMVPVISMALSNTSRAHHRNPNYAL